MKKVNILLVLCLLLLLAGCHQGYEIEVVNNSGQRLEIISLDTERNATSYSVESSKTIKVKVWYKLRVRHTNVVWDYDFPNIPLPDSCGKRVGMNRYLQRFQIEKDGSVIVLLPEAQFPIKASQITQPEGYPVRPTQSGK